VPARVASADSFQSISCDLPPSRFVPQQLLDFGSHFVGTFDDYVILSWTEQVFGIGPWRTQEGRAAREGLEDAYCRNAAEPVCVLLTRYVQGQRRLRICSGSGKVGKITAKIYACVVQHSKPGFRVANSMRQNPQSGRFHHGCDKKLLQLPRTLFVSPVSNPEEVDCFRALDWSKHAGIGRFVESPDLWDSETIPVDLSNGFPECQDSIYQVKLKTKNVAGIRICAMVGIVKQSAESEFLFPGKNSIHQRRLVPFVQNDNVRVA